MKIVPKYTKNNTKKHNKEKKKHCDLCKNLSDATLWWCVLGQPLSRPQRWLWLET